MTTHAHPDFAVAVQAVIDRYPLRGGIIVLLCVVSGCYILYHSVVLFAILARMFVLPKARPNKTVQVDKRRLSIANGSWAVITGASDGIGREFALQLAAKAFNILLISRSKGKLDVVADEVRKINPNAEVIVLPFDFTKAHGAPGARNPAPEPGVPASANNYEVLKAAIDKIDVGVLVNNVAVNHAFPVPFMEESESLIEDIVEVDVLAQMRMARMVLPQMLARKAGTIINIGSMAGKVPSALLSVYSGSKAFLRFWSQALALEVRGKGVHVEHVNTYFVATNMSKIRKPTMLSPTPKDYVASVLQEVGNSINSTPYPPHRLLNWVLDNFVSEKEQITQSAGMHHSIRQRALAKIAREAKQQ